MEEKLIDHLFRHHYGKMVSVLIRIFGFSNLETIEDAIQDTFLKASISWRNKIPNNPEAWLTKASKNRVVDIFRKINAQKQRENLIENSSEAMVISDLFLDSEIEDSQLRMIFTACHPKLKKEDQLVFALKTISGFSTNEIATALLMKVETIKKRLLRARKFIIEKEVSFTIPTGKDLSKRLENVLKVIYLIFNEGFHSNNKDVLIKKDLCGEAMRLVQIVLKNKTIRNYSCYALFALLCFHASRLESKTSIENEIIDLKNQNRTLWYSPLINLGKSALQKAFEASVYSSYHYEAAIAYEHVKAPTFNNTNWQNILNYYLALNEIYASPINLLNISLVHLQLKDAQSSLKELKSLNIENFKQRKYLFYGAWAEYYLFMGKSNNAITFLEKAIDSVSNKSELEYLQKKKKLITKL